jgi:uncharacterized membrane protein (DUF4010 family)
LAHYLATSHRIEFLPRPTEYLRVTENEAMVHIGAAALGGLAVGIEREWSGHASGPQARFAGVRTFTLLGGLAGVAGWLWMHGDHAPAAVVLASAGALILVAYVAAMRQDIGGTTEVAALVVLAAGFLAGSGRLTLASGVIATTVLMLVEKSGLHALVARLNDEEIRAGARFAVMAVVILPLLPDQAYGPFGGIRPRQLWAVVLLFTAISFAGYIVRRIIGGKESDVVAGLLGGLVSSTQVTLVHARTSASEPRRALSLACGAVAASTMLFLRTGFAAAVLSPPLAQALLPYIGSGLLAGALATAATWRRSKPGAALEPPRNPLQLRSAVQMAAVFQVVISVAFILRERFGNAGLVATAAVAGVTDVDAATISVARAAGEGVEAAAGAQAVAAAILANTLLKLVLALLFGSNAFRIATGAGLAVICAAVAIAMLLA